MDAAFGSIATRGYQDELIHYLGTSIGRRHYRRNYTQLWAKEETLSEQAAAAQAYQAYLKKYLRCVKGIDDNLGRLLTYLKDHQMLENTVIIYTSDQGMMLGEHDYMDKRWMYEESMRVPFIVRYPKSIPAGSSTKTLISNVDFAPTLLDFADVAAPPSMQGRSFRSILETGQQPKNWRTGLYYRYWMHLAHHDNPSHFGIRTATHKLIFYYGCTMNGEKQTPPGWELYDLINDPHETRNVYDNPAHQALITELKTHLATLRQEVGDEDQEFPAIKAVVDEFWDYSAADQERARTISAAYLKAQLAPKPDKKSRN
jgi:N-acetylglucosamine-6-sulfatase